MKIQPLAKSETEISFILQDSNTIIANTLRRLMISEVPTLAVEDITFIKNDSALYDEILSHRIGLIPLKTDLKSYQEKEKCTCKEQGCAKCQLILTLKATGPCTVYSESLISQDPVIKPVFKDIPIVKLLKGQELELEATAQLGKGKDHVKFTPGVIFYKELPIIKIKNKKEVEQRIKPIENQVTIDKEELKIKDLVNFNVDLLENYCTDSINIEYSKKDFIFIIENFGQLKPKEILEKSIEIFNDKLEELAKLIKESKASKLTTLTKKIKG